MVHSFRYLRWPKYSLFSGTTVACYRLSFWNLLVNTVQRTTHLLYVYQQRDRKHQALVYVYDVIFFLIGSSSMEKHPIMYVVTVCQWFIDRWGYRKQDKWAFSGTTVACYRLSFWNLLVNTVQRTTHLLYVYQERDSKHQTLALLAYHWTTPVTKPKNSF
jgi:hypothetical protein